MAAKKFCIFLTVTRPNFTFAKWPEIDKNSVHVLKQEKNLPEQILQRKETDKENLMEPEKKMYANKVSLHAPGILLDKDLPSLSPFSTSRFDTLVQ
ncbi:hypothetical protein CEXT_293361 [Caerostris extrusa]|uniref:Uncharacterized protein n=1 Tax=Caerostris extrusa TaxID=172846 RepID=A0AAV4TIS5_CAEEX|nr:hypothetical protein CEXT_293361 [Caerostris extrusa]